METSTLPQNGDKPYRLGLVLGGGGARGLAHLGVLEALQEAGIKPDVISGVSAGAIVGAFYANGMAPRKIHEVIKSKGVFDYTRPKFFSGGFLKLDGLKKSLEESLTVGYIEDLKIPLIIAATCLQSGACEFISEGDLAQWVTASSTIPVLFEPVEVNGKLYVDGGLATNFPIKPLLSQCEKIIGVNVSPLSGEARLKNVWDVASRVFEISINSDLRDLRESCSLYIQPENIEKFGLFSIKKADEIYQTGYDTTLKALKANVNLVE